MSSSNPGRRLPGFERKFAVWSGRLTIAIGIIVIAGWFFDVPTLKSVVPGLGTMKFNTALSFVLLGFALMLAIDVQNRRAPVRQRVAGIIFLSLVVAALSSGTLLEYLFNVDFGIDQMVFRDPGSEVTPPGRMSPITASIFIFLSLAMLLSPFEGVPRSVPQGLSVTGLFLAMIALLAYLYSVESLSELYPYSTIAVHTTVAFVLLSIGLLFLHPASGFIAVFTASEYGGLVGRVLLPLSILVLVLLGVWVNYSGSQRFRDPSFTVVFIVSLGIALISILIWWNAKQLTRLDLVQKQTIQLLQQKEQALEQANEELESRVRQRTQELDLQATIVSNIAEGVCLIKAVDQTIAYANPKFERMFGYGPGELNGKHVSILNYGTEPREAVRIANEITESILEKGAVTYEIQNVRKDGTPFWCRATTSQFQHPQYGPVLVAVHEDVTEEKIAETELRRSEQKYHELVELASDGIFVADLDGRYTDVNKAGQRMLGYAKEEIVGKMIVDFIHPTEIPRLMASKELLMPPGSVQVEEWRMRRKDGSYVPVEVSSKVYPDQRWLGFVRDISKRKEYEKSLAEKAEKLARSNVELEQFAYVTSHDLREPMRVVTNYAELIDRRYKHQLDESAARYLAYIVDGVSRMQSLIGDLLTYSRVGREESRQERTDLNGVLEQVHEDLKLKIEETHAKLTSDPLPEVWVNRFQIVQLLQNLIDNAIKFHRPGVAPQIHVSAKQRGREWVFSVADNGIGIEPQYLNRIFVIFQRLHTRTEYPGTGIGLAICKKIVEQYGGSIWVESQAGSGSTFYFTLPPAGAGESEKIAS